MNNASAILRTLVVYAICVPVAIWVGYMLTDVAQIQWAPRSSLIYAGIFVLVLCLPLLLRWHYILLVLTLNLGMTVFFLPGQPPLWMSVLALSLGISVLQRCLNRGMRFIPASSVTAPLICMAVVVLFTAKLTGGIGLHSLGGENMGGKKYFYVLGGIAAFFALTARRIPPNRAVLYLALYFLPPCISVIGDLAGFLPSSFNFIYWFLPANGYVLDESGTDMGAFRFGGLGAVGGAFFIFMLAKYGIRGIFMSGRLWRPILFICFCCLIPFGGFRSALIGLAMVFCFQFYLEGLHRTRLMPRFVVAGLLAFALAVPFAKHLPYGIQRSLSFLPLNVDFAIKEGARGSAEWRYQMWQAELPQVPRHLILGKGYLLTQEDFEFVITKTFAVVSADQTPSAIAGDYHSGPLSLIIPFGIWGVIAYIWFLIAGIRALYANFRYGDESLRTVNTLLFASFLGHVLMYFFVFGSLEGDTVSFCAVLGLGISINGGICRPAPEPVQAKQDTLSPARLRRLQVGFQR